MDKSCRRILFCNFCQNNKGNLSTSVLAYAAGIVSFLLNTSVKQSFTSAPGSNPHVAVAQPQLQLPSLATIPTMILAPVLLFVFFVAGILFSHHLSGKAQHPFNQEQALISTQSMVFLAANRYSGSLAGQSFAVTEVSKTRAANFLINRDLFVAVPENKKFKQILNPYSVPSVWENSTSISLGIDPHNILVWPDRGGLFQKFLDV